MKYFSKLLSMLLVGVVLVSTACTDYADDIANTNERLEEVQADVEDILELLDKIECEHGDALDAIIAGHCDDLAGLAEDIADANDEILALKGVDADLKKSIEFINTLLKELAGEQDEEKLLSAMATWNALFDGLKVFYETQLEGLLSDVEAAKAFMAAINETLNNYKATYSQKSGMAAVVEDLETVIAKFQALEKEFAQYKEDVEVEFSKVYAAIASLGSVQSIVYVPEYSDGCATINVAYINNMIVEARSTMEFMVTPASGAGKIVSMWTENPEVLAIVHEDLKERLNTRSAEHLFNVANVYVKNGEPDRLMVEFDTRHLDPAFYAGEKSYALSLVYNAGNEGDVTSEANVASCFAKAIVTTKPEILNVEIVDATDKFITNTVGEHHDIQYTNAPRGNQEIPVTLLDMHKIAFYVTGFEKEFRTLEEMLAQGYDLNLVNDIKPTDKAGYKMDFTNCLGNVPQTKDPLTASFKYTEGEHDYYQSEIAEDCRKKEYIGYLGTYKYNYVVESNYYVYDPAVTLDPESNDLTPDVFYAESEVEIAPLAIEYKITLNDILWDYETDKAEDAKGEAVARYSRLGIELPELPDQLDAALKEANAGVMAWEILVGNTPADVKFTITDEVDDDNTNLSDAWAEVKHDNPFGCNHNSGPCSYYLDIKNFQWESWEENVNEDDVLRSYDIDVLYKTPVVHLFFQFDVNTIDRCRKPITVDYGTFAEIVYHSNLEFNYDGEGDILDKLFEARIANGQEKHYASTNTANWLKDNFVDHAYAVNKNEINGAEFENSKLTFDIVSGVQYEFDVDYNYEDKAGVVDTVVADVLNYKKDFNTWYGQEFIVKKAIDFKSPDYAFVGVEEFFIYDSNGKKVVDARPHYDPLLPADFVVGDAASIASHPMSVFSIERVNMFAAFDVVKSHNFRIELPSDADHANCATLAIDNYVSIDAIVNTPADVKDNKEKDTNYRAYESGIYKDNKMYQDLGGNWHYEYEDAIRPMFRATGVKDVAHIFFNKVNDFSDYSYALAYYGYDPYVAVDADLYVANSNGTQYRVETNFDKDVNAVYGVSRVNYSEFEAKQYYPFGNLEKLGDIKVTLSAAVHTYNTRVAQAFSLKDKRGAELINNVEKDSVAPFFVKGNGTNGFAKDVYVGDVFGFPYIYEDCNHVNYTVAQPKEALTLKFTYNKENIPAELLQYFHFDATNGIVTFDYNPEITLKKPIVIPVVMEFVSPWTCSSETLKAETTVTFEQGQIL